MVVFMKKLLIMVFVVLTVMACQFDVPIKELTSAKSAITEAEKYKADKYAPEELKEAKKYIYESHKFVKEEKTDEAVNSAAKAENKALEAKNKSIPLYAKDVISETNKIISKADFALAEKYSADNYFEASEGIIEAEGLLQKGSNLEGLNAALAAKEKAEKALSDSIAKIPEFKERIKSVKDKADKIRREGGDKFAAEELKEIYDLLIKADEYLDDENLRDSLRLIEEAEKKLIPLEEKAVVYKKTTDAEKAVENSDALLKKAENAMAYEYASDKYTEAMEAQTEASEALKNKKYDEAITHAEKSSKLSVEAWNASIAKKPELQASLDKTKAAYTELKTNGAEDFASEQMKQAQENIELAEKYLAEDNLKQALNHIDYAVSAVESAKMKDGKFLAEMKIKKAEELFNEINTEDNRKRFLEDINSIDSYIGSAKTDFEESKYTEASSNADKALSQIDKIKLSMQQTEVIDDSSKEVDPKPEGSTEYTVKYNPKNRDCLWKIALRVYKRADLWPLIYAANRDKIKDPDLIFPGQKLVIPPIPEKKVTVSDEEAEKIEDDNMPDEGNSQDVDQDGKTDMKDNTETE